MLSEKQIELVNKMASKETFKYQGELIPGADVKADIDYKFQITGHRKMISVGEYYDYLKLEVVITSLNDVFSRIIFGFDKEFKDLDLSKMFETQLYPFYSNLNKEIQGYLKYFNSGDDFIRTTIDDFKFDLKNPENITESKSLLKHYIQPNEITSQRDGFRRVAKLRKLPFKDVVRDWFEDHKDIHGLNNGEMKTVIQILINVK